MKDLVAQRIYKDMRPFTIADDVAFWEIAFDMWNKIDYSSFVGIEKLV